MSGHSIEKNKNKKVQLFYTCPYLKVYPSHSTMATTGQNKSLSSLLLFPGEHKWFWEAHYFNKPPRDQWGVRGLSSYIQRLALPTATVWPGFSVCLTCPWTILHSFLFTGLFLFTHSSQTSAMTKKFLCNKISLLTSVRTITCVNCLPLTSHLKVSKNTNYRCQRAVNR